VQINLRETEVNGHSLGDVEDLAVLTDDEDETIQRLQHTTRHASRLQRVNYLPKFYSVFERKPTQLPPLAVRVSCDL